MLLYSKKAKRIQKIHEFEIVLLAIVFFVAILLIMKPEIIEIGQNLAGKAPDELIKGFLEGEETNQTNITIEQELNETLETLENDSLNLSEEPEINISINQSLNITINATSNTTTNEPANKTINQSINQSINYTINQIINETVNETINETSNISLTNITVNESINLSINQTINQTINKTANKTLNQTTNITINYTKEEPDKDIITITFSRDNLLFEKSDGYDLISLENLPVSEEEGELMLPFKLVYLSIPYDQEFERIEITGYSEEELEGVYRVPEFPGYEQKDTLERIDFAPINLEKYFAAAFYPRSIVEVATTGTMRENKFLVVKINPVRYNPLMRQLVFYSHISFKPVFKEAEKKEAGQRYKKSALEKETAFDSLIKNLVENPEQIKENKPKIELEKETLVNDLITGHSIRDNELKSGSFFNFLKNIIEYFAGLARRYGNLLTGNVILGGDLAPRSVPPFQNTSIDYVIITSNYDINGKYVGDMQGTFQRLADWKTKKGITTLVVNVSWIKENFPEGYDTQESIRNFIREAKNKWGTSYVLLAGDTGIISERIVYDASWSLDTPTDLYYADIDTDWNPNRDYLIKDHEVAAAFADVFVGRAPVNDQEQADVFIDKILIYEKSAPSDYVNEVLFLAGPFGTCEDGETFPEHKEYLNATFLPDYIQLYRLYTPETFYVPKNPIYLPVFSDLDNAGVTESIIATYIKEENNTKVFVFSVDGNDFGNWPVEIEGKTKAVYAEDTDSDGYEEVYVLIEKSDRSTHVYGYDYQGNALPEWNDITILTDKLSISDMNGDAFNEIIYIDDDCYVHVLDSDRDELSGWPQQMALGGDYTGTDLCSLLIPVIKDPDADGNKELCIKSNGSASYKAEKVYCFNETGGPINAAWPLNLSEMGLGYFTRRLFFEDIDLDGEIEIAVNAFDGTDNIYTYVFERDGSVKAGWPQQITSNMILRLEDVWGDEKKEIIATKIIGSLDEVAPQTPDTIIIWKENGDILDGWPIDNVFATNLKIADFDNDGEKELFFIGRIVVEVSSPGYEGYKATMHLYLLNNDCSNNTEDWPIQDFQYDSQPTIADVDKDGQTEILISGYFQETPLENNVYIFKPDASIYDVIDGVQTNQIQTEDMDGDVFPEIIFSNMDYGDLIYVANHTCDILANWPVNDAWQDAAANKNTLQIGDFDDEPGLELLYFTTDKSSVNCRRLDASNCTGWPRRIYDDLSVLQYTADDVLNRFNAVAELNTGYHIVNHEDHSFFYGLGAGYKCSGDMISSDDALLLTNAPQYSIIWSDGCHPNAFDYSSISESFMNNPNGGAVAFIGNTRNGLTNQRVQDDEFFNAVYKLGLYRLGEAFVNSQTFAITTYNRYVMNLLGDPTLEVWTDTPQNLNAAYPATLELGLQTFQVTVRDEESNPLPNATVCITKNDEIFEKAITDVSGVATLTISPRTTGNSNLTVTAHNFYPLETNIDITRTRNPHLIIDDVKVIDDCSGGRSVGNGNGLIDAGETIEVNITLENKGDSAAFNNNAELMTEHACVEISQNNAVYETMLSGQKSTESFIVRFRPDCQDFSRIRFNLILTGSGYYNLERFSLEVFAPVLEHFISKVDDDSEGMSMGDGDRIPEPGETIMLPLIIKNQGKGIAEDIQVLLTSENSEIAILEGTAFRSDIMPGEEFEVNNLRFSIGSSFSEEYVPLRLEITDSYERSVTANLNITKPEDVSGIKFVSATLKSLKIQWDSPSDSGNLKGYNVYKSENQTGPFERINERIVTSASIFEDSRIEPGVTYYYRVAAVDNSSTEGEWSADARIKAGLALLPGWPQELGRGIESAPKVEDIDGDGDLEIFVAADKVYGFHHNGTLIEHFPLSEGSYFRATVAIDDLEGDGDFEIVGHSTDDTRLHVWDISTGTELWNKRTSGFALSSPLIADLDGDGLKEVVTGASNMNLYAWHYNGTEVADGDNNPSTDGVLGVIDQNFAYGSPSVGDVDLDGDLEIFWGSGKSRKLYAWHHNGTEVVDGDKNASTKGVFAILNGTVNSDPVIADLDNDREPEIVVSTGQNVFVFKNNKTLLLKKSICCMEGEITSSPAIGDLDGDGQLDIVIGNSDRVYAFDLQGNNLQGWPKSGFGEIRSSAVLADINQDSYLEVMVGSYDKNLYGVLKNGSTVPGFPFKTEETITDSPTIADLDNDGSAELIVTSNDANIYVLELNSVYNEDLVMWGQSMFDTQNTGRFYYECDNDFVCGNWSNPGEDCGIRDCYCWCIAELGCGGNGTETKACPQAPPPPADGDSDSDSDGDGDWGRITCEENWTCTNWLPCFNGIQTRTCTDQNNCSTNQSRPALMQTCSSTIGGEENQSLNQSYNPEENITTDEETSFEETPGTVNIILLLNNNTTKTAGIIVIIGLVSLMIYSSIKKKRQELNNKFSKLDQYIKECLGQNKSSEFIAQKLKSVGWPEEFVKNRIKEVGKNENLQTR